MEYEWASMAELESQYSSDLKRLKKKSYRLKKSKSNSIQVKSAIVNSIIRDKTEDIRIIRSKQIYTYNCLKDEELLMLAPMQRKVAGLRQSYSYTEVAKILEKQPSEVFIIYQQAIRKIRKLRAQAIRGIPQGLSEQQEKIYVLYKCGLAPTDIAKSLDITTNSVRVQLSRINNKIGNNLLNKII